MCGCVGNESNPGDVISSTATHRRAEVESTRGIVDQHGALWTSTSHVNPYFPSEHCRHIICSFYLQIIQGNTNTYSTEMRDLDPPIIGRNIRVVPVSSHPKYICMRVEMYGCAWNGKG